MASKTWKKFEGVVARFFGAERTPLSGGNSKMTRSDSLHEELYVECKYGKRCAPWSLYKDAAEKAEVEGKVPCLALKETGQRGFLVVVHSDNLQRVAQLAREGDSDGHG